MKFLKAFAEVGKMLDTAIQDLLKAPETDFTSTYSHLVAAFKRKNGLSINSLVHCAFSNSLKRKQLSFLFDLDNQDIVNFSFKDFDGAQLAELTDQDRDFICQIMPVHFSRIESLVRKITKEMREDFGRDYKSEVIDRNGFTCYMSREASMIEKDYRTNFMADIHSNPTKKRVYPFEMR